MDFEVQTRFAAPLAELRIRGELDLSTGHHLAWSVEQAVVQHCTVVAVDLTGVPFIDCSAVGVLVGAVHRLREASGELVVTGASPQVRRLLELTGTCSVLGIGEGDPTDAVLQPA